MIKKGGVIMTNTTMTMKKIKLMTGDQIAALAEEPVR